MVLNLWLQIRALLKRTAGERQLEEELHFHFDRQVESYLRLGLTSEEAKRRTRLTFGHLDQVADECRAERRLRWAEVLLQDARYGLRMLRKQPGFAVAVILILALGIGVNIAIFSIVDTVLLHPLSFTDPGKLVVLTEYNTANRIAKTGASYPDYAAWLRQSRRFEKLAAYWNVSGDGMVFDSASTPERVRFSIVTNSFFSTLDVSPVMGRGFSTTDEIPGAPKVFLVSNALWRRSLGGKAGAIGKTFRLDGESFTLIGVLPARFSFPQKCDVWLPLAVLTAGQLADRVSHPFWGVGRLRAGTDIRSVQSDMNFAATKLAREYPQTNRNWAVRVTPLLDEFAGNIRQSLLVLFGVVFFILLIACTSVVSLQLARAESRQKEFAVRAALGAGRGRLICQTLIENLLITTISTGLALILSTWGLHLVGALGTGATAGIEQFRMNGPMLGFACALAILTGALIALTPGTQMSRVRFNASLRVGTGAGTNPGSHRVRNSLVIAEVSITLLLLCGAGLMLRSFAQLRGVNPGFDADHLITMRIALPEARYPKLGQRTRFLDELLERIKESPRVRAAAAVSTLPLSGENNWESISIADSPVEDWGRAPSVEQRSISVDYFRAMGIRLIRGQQFKERDLAGQNHGVIVNQSLADKFWPGLDPIGKRLSTIDDQSYWREVIGVVDNVKHFGLEADVEPEMYIPYGWWSSMNLVVRSAINSSSLAPIVCREVAALDKSVPVYDVATMDVVVSRSIASQRLDLYLLLCFAILALLLSGMGIYGLLAFVVNRRKHEIALRMALGATDSQMLRQVMGTGVKPVMIGLVPARWLLGRLHA